MASETDTEYKNIIKDGDSKVVPVSTRCDNNWSPDNVFEESGDSEYDTDLEICPSKEGIYNPNSRSKAKGQRQLSRDKQILF